MTQRVIMNRLDRAIAAVAPATALRRLQARQALAMASGGWTGARRDRRQTEGWSTTGTGGASADYDNLADLPALRERSRDLDRNNPIAGGAINTQCTNVVGAGLMVQSTVDREILALVGLDEAACEDWQRAAEREFYLWAGSRDCDVTRSQDLYGLQDLVLRTTALSGDCFTVRRRAERPNRRLDLCLQVIEADRVCNPRSQRDTETLRDGVERDADGAATAYHFVNRHSTDIGGIARTWTRLPAYGAETGLWLVLHHFDRLRPGQSRGIPYLAPVIEQLKQLGRYSDAELMAAVVNACFAIVTKTDSGGPVTTPLQQTGQAAANLPLGQVKLDFESGMVIEGFRPNESIEGFTPGRPNAAFDPFFQAMLRQIGVRLEIPFELLVKHFTASYSAARAALLEAWKFFRKRRAWLVGSFCQPVYEMVVTEAVAKGLLAAPGFFDDPLIRAAYLGAEWLGPSPGQIDPLKEVDAAEKRIAIGVSSIARETAELTGGDWEAVHRQRVREAAARKADGLDVPAPVERPALPSPEGERQDRPEQGDREAA